MCGKRICPTFEAAWIDSIYVGITKSNRPTRLLRQVKLFHNVGPTTLLTALINTVVLLW